MLQRASCAAGCAGTDHGIECEHAQCRALVGACRRNGSLMDNARLQSAETVDGGFTGN